MNATVQSFLIVAALTLAGTQSGWAETRPSDPYLTRLLHETYKKSIRLRGASINVTTTAGFVTLKGQVNDFLSKHEAERIARRIDGVRGVTNRIEVQSVRRPDRDIQNDIRRRLSQSSFVRPDNLKVEVANGIATISGNVISWGHSRQALKVASEVRGVRLVRNHLTFGLAAAGTSDEQLKQLVEAEFNRDIYLADLPIEITVDGGIVTIDGQVSSLYQKERATEEARLVANVKDVNNQLEIASHVILIESDVPPSDAEVLQLVTNELDADPRISVSGISLHVQNGSVTLSGTVATMFERQLSARIARSVLGVVRVDNQMTVSAGQKSNDAVRDDVQFNLRSDSQLASESINIVVTDGSVTLAGEVKDFASKFRAARLASRVRGVASVTNDLRVQWSERFSDNDLAQGVRDRLHANWSTRSLVSAITVEVRQGNVKLSGSVSRWSQRREAGRIAMRIDGVRNVDNQIHVTSQ